MAGLHTRSQLTVLYSKLGLRDTPQLTEHNTATQAADL